MPLGSSAREFVLKIVADVTDATKGIDKVQESTAGMKSKVLGVGKAVAGGLAVGAIAQFGKSSVLAASEAEQSVGAMSSVFGSFAGDMDKFGSTSAENLGITTQEFNQLSAVTGSLMKNAGLPMEKVTKGTQDLTQRAADLAAMFGTDVSGAVQAMGSAFKGEYDPLEAYGISLKASDVNARAMAEGYVDASGNVTDAGKAIAAQEIIMEQSAQAAGTFSKESDTLAGTTSIMTAKFNDTQAELGTKLLPIIMTLVSYMMPLVDLFLRYADILVPLAIVIGGLALAMKGYQAVTMAVQAATLVATAAQWLWNAAITANPIGILVVVIAAVIAGVILLYTKVDWFRDFVDKAIDGIVGAWNGFLDIIVGVYNWVRDNWPLLLAIITGPFGIAVGLIINNWDTIKNAGQTAINAITGFMGNVWNIISWPFKQAAGLVGDAWNPIKDFFRDLPSNISNFFGGLADAITWPFRSAFDSIKWLWNNTVGGFGFSIPSWVPGVGGKNFNIPSMAKGGIVSRPTLALIGEAGPEAVVPLGSGGFGTTVINVYALTANAEVGRRVYESLREYERTTGK